MRPGTLAVATGVLALLACPATLCAADTAKTAPTAGMPTPEERRKMAELAAVDRAKMMAQLHLSDPVSLPEPATDPKRPPGTHPVGGASPNWTDDVPGHTIVRSGWGNWSNYDLAKADRYPIPDVLTLNSGEPVRDAKTWWERRRPEIVAAFQSEIYGRIPEHTPKVTWEVTERTDWTLSGTANLKEIVGHIDNSSFPGARPRVDIALYIPANAAGPVPVMVVASWNTTGKGFGPPPSGPTAMQQVIAHGWGYALVNTYAIQADSGAGLDAGIIGLVNGGIRGNPTTGGPLPRGRGGSAARSTILKRTRTWIRSASASRVIPDGARRRFSPPRWIRAGQSPIRAVRASAAQSCTATTWASQWTMSAERASITGWPAIF